MCGDNANPTACSSYYDSSSCTGDSDCAWDSGASTCGNKPGCDTYTDSSACTTASCDWSNSACLSKSAYCESLTDSTACGNGSGCSWVNEMCGETVVIECWTLGDYDACNG